MIRKFLRLFPYVRQLEAEVARLSKELQTERNLANSRDRYINALEAAREIQAERLSRYDAEAFDTKAEIRSRSKDQEPEREL